MKVVLIHGKNSNPSEKWYPWLIQELRKRNIEVIAPELPKPNDPVMDEWLKEIDKTKPDNNTILIGHSRGGGAILKWLEHLEQNKKIKKVILVATISGLLKDKAIPSETNYGFYSEKGFDYEKIKSHCNDFVVMHSKDDEWVPFESGIKNANELNAKFLVFENRNHFGIKTTPEFPELLQEITDKLE